MTILLYVLGFVFALIVSPIVALVCVMLLAGLAKTAAPAVAFVSSALSLFCAMFLFTRCALWLGSQATLGMFIVVFVAIMLNDVGRVARQQQQNEKPPVDDVEQYLTSKEQETGKSTELAHLFGDAVGLWVAFLLGV